MKADGQKFLDSLRSLPSDTFGSHFSKVASKLGLGARLDPNELRLLYGAALYAGLCNEAFNGSGRGAGETRREVEAFRTGVEGRFMVAWDLLRASTGWQALSDSEREAIEQHFLRVVVEEKNLAW
jgi:hypothetical protein